MQEQSFFHVDFGNVLTILSLIGTVLAAVYTVLVRLTGMEVRLNNLEEESKKQTDILVQLATQRERLNAMDIRTTAQDKRIDALYAALTQRGT